VLTALLAFAAASALLVLLPGPDTLIVLRSVVLHGRRRAARVALGVLTGLSIWIVAAALGITALLRASHDGYLALRLVGAVYLIYIGIQSLRSRTLGQSVEHQPPRFSLLGSTFRGGLLTDLLNPKVGVFFITFLPAFIPHRAPVATTTLAMGAIFAIEGTIYFAALLLFVDRLTAWLGRERIRRRLNRATGLVFIGFGLRLATEG